MMRRLMGSDEPTPAPQPLPEENFNIFDDSEEQSENEDDVSSQLYLLFSLDSLNTLIISMF